MPSLLYDKRVCGLFDMWCRMDGGPPTIIVHLFDYPYEDPGEDIAAFFADFGVVKGVCHQKYLRNGDIATSTRLVDIVLSGTPSQIGHYQQLHLLGMVSWPTYLVQYLCHTWAQGS